jgi:hypothetical protein
MNTSHRSRKRTAFVPRIIFQTAAVVGVLPLCVACTAKTDPVSAGVAELGFTGDHPLPGVADMAFDGSRGDSSLGVANMGFDGGTPSVAAIGFDGGLPSVAAMGFDGGAPSVASIGFDGGLPSVAAMGFDGGTGLGVAAMGFDASDDVELGVALQAFTTSKG